MKLQEWMTHNNITLSKLYRAVKMQEVGCPTKATLSNIVHGTKEPGLELALVITKLTTGVVEPCDMLVDRKRKYTSRGDNIHSFNKPSLDILLREL